MFVSFKFAFILEILIQGFPSLLKVSLEEWRIELRVSLLLSWRNRDSEIALLPSYSLFIWHLLSFHWFFILPLSLPRTNK